MPQEAAHRFRKVGALQRVGDLRLQEADLVTAVEPLTFVAQPMERLLTDQLRHAVGELDLVAGAALHACEVGDHLGHQHVAADDRQVRRRVLRRRLFHQAEHLDQPSIVLAGAQDAVAVGLIARHLGHRDHVAAGVAVDVGKLAQARRVRQHKVVRQQDGERIVADEGARAPDGVAKPQRHLLAHGDHGAGLDLGRAQQFQRIGLAALAQRGLQLEGDVEMLDQGGLAAPGHQAELLDPGRARLLDRVLDEWLVDHRQHFLGDGLGGRQESRAEARNGQHGLAQRLDHDGFSEEAR